MGTQPYQAALEKSLASSSLALSSRISSRKIANPSDRSSLLRRFDDVFAEVPAVRPAELEEGFRLRYQVYCLDRGFEEAADCPDGLERDVYDSYAHHSLLRERATGHPLGTVRLVHPSATPNWITKLPLAAYADIDSIEELMRLPGGTTAEVSRFAISRNARQCLSQPPAGTADTSDGADAAWRQRLLPYMSLGLVRGLIRQSQEHGITHWCLAAEPSLLRRLRSFGLHFKDAGPMVNHRGLRQICYAELDDLLLRAETERPECWEIMTQDGQLTTPDAARSVA